jgi:hypothetical protein
MIRWQPKNVSILIFNYKQLKFSAEAFRQRPVGEDFGMKILKYRPSWNRASPVKGGAE